MAHQSVLLHEAINGLNIKPEGIYMDATFGRGGHTQEILKHLSEKGRVIAIDKDWQAIAHAKKYFEHESRLTVCQGSFAELKHFVQIADAVGRIDGILLDLGVSSPQLDDAERGFSFIKDGPLDMRMDTAQPLDAETFVNEASVDEMAYVFKCYGEERFAKRIARAIEEKRTLERITTTLMLAEIVKQANPKWEKHKHPATRVFQAIRIHVNQELNDLERVLRAAVDCLAKGGRLAVISFHSLEDRMVKHFMRDEEQGEQLPKGVPVRACDVKQHFKRVGKAIKPTDEEIRANVRARSAVLRIGEKNI